IYDEADSVRLIKQCMDELDVDPKRFAPRAIKRQISDAKNQLIDAEGYRIKVGSFFEQTAADVYEIYEQRAHSMNAMDFDDLVFEDDFQDATVIRLEQNYRSTQTILSAANGVVGNNVARKSKTLWTDLGEGDPIHIRELEDEHAEARFVVNEIERTVDQGGSRDEVAVFYRTNAQSRVLEDMLTRYKLPYQVIG